MVLYVNDHNCQFDEAFSTETNQSGCVWTSLANGVDAVTHGERKPTPDAIHRLVHEWEETVPSSDGWSIPDADLAMSRMGIPFRNLTGGRFEGIRFEHNAGRYVIAQGDSDQFGNNTCAGKFNGDHCIGIHPDEMIGRRLADGSVIPDPNGEMFWAVDDPVCKKRRWEKPAVIRDYVEKLDPHARYGSFTTPVPKVSDPILRYGGRALDKPTKKVVKHQHGVFRKPTSASSRLNTKEVGSTFIAYQVTNTGQDHGGSRRWFGNRRGRRWIHESAF